MANNGLIGLLSLVSGVGQGYERGEEQKKADYIQSQANDRVASQQKLQDQLRVAQVITDSFDPAKNKDQTPEGVKAYAKENAPDLTDAQFAAHPLVQRMFSGGDQQAQPSPNHQLQAPPAQVQTTGHPGVTAPQVQAPAQQQDVTQSTPRLTAPQVQAPAQQQDVTQSTPRLTAPPNDENSFRQSVGMPYRTAQGALIIPNAANRYHYGLPEAAFNIHYMNNEVGNINRQNGVNPPQAPVAQSAPPQLNAGGNPQQGAFQVPMPPIGQGATDQQVTARDAYKQPLVANNGGAADTGVQNSNLTAPTVTAPQAQTTPPSLQAPQMGQPAQSTTLQAPTASSAYPGQGQQQTVFARMQAKAAADAQQDDIVKARGIIQAAGRDETMLAEQLPTMPEGPARDMVQNAYNVLKAQNNIQKAIDSNNPSAGLEANESIKDSDPSSYKVNKELFTSMQKKLDQIQAKANGVTTVQDVEHMLDGNARDKQSMQALATSLQARMTDNDVSSNTKQYIDNLINDPHHGILANIKSGTYQDSDATKKFNKQVDLLNAKIGETNAHSVALNALTAKAKAQVEQGNARISIDAGKAQAYENKQAATGSGSAVNHETGSITINPNKLAPSDRILLGSLNTQYRQQGSIIAAANKQIEVYQLKQVEVKQHHNSSTDSTVATLKTYIDTENAKIAMANKTATALYGQIHDIAAKTSKGTGGSSGGALPPMGKHIPIHQANGITVDQSTGYVYKNGVPTGHRMKH